MPDSIPPRHGVPLILCAPSGTGKTTLSHRLRSEFPKLGFSISATTRPARAGEVHGKDYFFLSREEFLLRRDNQAFAEWAEVHGNFYGTPLAETKEILEGGQDMLFDIDVQGAARLRLSLPYSVCVFCFPPSLAELEKRLRGRASDTDENIARRLRAAKNEIKEAHWFDYWLINDDIDQACDKLRAIYLASGLRPNLRPNLPELVISND